MECTLQGCWRCKSLRAGEVGYICASIKKVSDASVGDTITIDSDPTEEALPGYKKVQPMVYCGIYPAEGEEDTKMSKDALEKLQVNDAAFHFEPETSTALGFGFRCGFLGLLHMEIIVERLEREFDLGSGHDLAERHLQGRADGRHSGDAAESVQPAGSAAGDRPHRGADGQARTSWCRTIMWAASWKSVPGAARQRCCHMEYITDRQRQSALRYATRTRSSMISSMH